MNSLEKKFRNNLIKHMFKFVIAFLILDFGFFLLYAFTGVIKITPMPYFLEKVLSPFLINIAAYLSTKKYNNGDYSSEQKNNGCAFGFLTIIGCMSIFHGYFTPLMCAPALSIIMCSTICTVDAMKRMLMYNYLIIVLSVANIIRELPQEASMYLQFMFVVGVMTTLSFVIALMVRNYNNKMMKEMENVYIKQLEYKKKLNYDFLTGVYSRAFIEDKMSMRDIEEEKRLGNKSSIVMFDIDNFKQINDTYGHEKGDLVLKRIGEIFIKYSDQNTTFARIGGEEFVGVLEKKSPEEYLDIVKNIRKEFEKSKYDFTLMPITISGGLVICDPGYDYDKITKIADNALYKSKAKGKNIIITLDENGNEDGIIRTICHFAR